MGEAVMATWDATTAMESGLEGRTPCSLVASAITGNVENAVKQSLSQH